MAAFLITKLGFRVAWRACALLIVVGAMSGRASAAGVPVRQAPGPYRLVVNRDSPGVLDRETLRAQLADELEAPVSLAADPVAGTVRVSYDAGSGELSVTFSSPDGRVLTRTVPAPAGAGEAGELAVLLAGNLARDQAGELLDDAAPVESPPANNESPPANNESPPAPSADPTVVRKAPAGLLSPGRVRLLAEVWTSRLSLLNGGARLSRGNAYLLANLSAHYESGRSLVGPGLAIGVTRSCFRFECGADVGTTYLNGGPSPSSGYTLDRLISRVRAQIAMSPRPGLAVFAGAGYGLTTYLRHAPENINQLELFAGVRL